MTYNALKKLHLYLHLCKWTKLPLMPFSWQCPLKFPPTASTKIFLNFGHKTENNKFLKQRVDNCGAASCAAPPDQTNDQAT